jgi:hypothetical protein
MLAKPSHTSVVELLDPFGEDSSPIRARDVERGSPSHIVLVALWALGVLDLVVLDASFQGFDLDAEPHLLAVVGLLVLPQSPDGSAQNSPKCDDIEIGNVLEKEIE